MKDEFRTTGNLDSSSDWNGGLIGDWEGAVRIRKYVLAAAAGSSSEHVAEINLTAI